MRLFLRATFVCALVSPFAFAQSNLHGRVLDPLGAGVPNASIDVVNGPHTSSSADGSYALALGTCPCTLRITAPTFAATVVTVQSTGSLAQDLTLRTPTRSEEVTVTATGTPTPLAQSGAPITILVAENDFPHSPEIQQPLRLTPGVQMTQNGGTGGATSLFIRGGESNANKVLLDGVPIEDVGGLVNFANVASAGIAQLEVLREPNSALYGSDALAGVVSLTSTRGATPVPALSYAVDGGNMSQLRQEGSAGVANGAMDYFATIARFDTRNNLPNNAFHNVTVSGNVGYKPDARTDVRVIARHVGTNGAQPNAFLLYGIAENSAQKEQDTFVSATAQRQATTALHTLVRYGHEGLRSQFYDYAPTGILYTPAGSKFGPNGYVGLTRTIAGANGYSVTGQAILQYLGTYPTASLQTANRDFAYAQADYRLNAHMVALGAFKYEAERGTSFYAPTLKTVDHRNQSYTVQLAGDAGSRLFYTVGSGIEKNEVFGNALTPRASVAFYAIRPGAQRFFSGTKLHGSFGKGIKGPNVAQQNGSLYGVFSSQANGASLIAQYKTQPLGAEYSRTYDAGVEQQFGDGRMRANATFFHNQFTNGLQYVSQAALVQLGLPAASAPQFKYGAYANSQAFRALGGELELEYRLTPRVFARAGYTYLDARIQRSFSSDALHPTYNTSSNFASVAIGAYAPLVGARPFRRAPHSGYFAVSYAGTRLTTQLSGTLVGRRDDSTFLTDKDFGNSLLLPNRNLDGGYQRLELTTEYRISRHLTTYANMQNLLNQTYSEAFGYSALPISVRGGMKFTLGGESWGLR